MLSTQLDPNSSYGFLNVFGLLESDFPRRSHVRLSLATLLTTSSGAGILTGKASSRIRVTLSLLQLNGEEVKSKGRSGSPQPPRGSLELRF